VTELTDPWADRAFLRDVQYRTDANLAARQSIYSYQEPRIDLQGRVIDLAAPTAGETVCDVGCGNGTYLAELARRGFAGRVLGLDLSTGMLAASRERLGAVKSAGTTRTGGPVGSSESPAAASSRRSAAPTSQASAETRRISAES
jgi:SAM-dependent methyltransferase